ncbi:MAG TPA: transcriptional regulator PdhR [Thauera sp.]|nr:transcriptional regulator PdhR [Thauera sp.]HHW63834.1 GntR family transcriptional regulator [Rhodocyclaceae bacterium]
MKVMPLQQRRLSDDIVERIETMILEGNLRPGERLPAERALAEEFGVSRPSLREAIQKLVARGLLTSRHGGGTFVSDALGSAFRDPMIELLGRNPEAQRDLMEFRHTLEGSCAYYAALRATEPDRERLKIAFERVQDSYLRQGRISRTEEGHNDALFHLAIAEASHNAVLLHTIRSLFDLVERNVVTNIGGMYTQGEGVRETLLSQHEALYKAIIDRRADDARRVAGEHLDYVQHVLAQAKDEARRTERAARRRVPA